MANISNNASTYKGPVGPMRHRCPQCSATGLKLRRCTGCLAVRYCSREHQVTHRPQHKSACNKVKKARAKLAEEDDRIRNATPDSMTPANAFETEVGRFWLISSTRDYMRARFALAGTHLLQLGTLDGVHEALEHMQDMLRLCRGDNMGLRHIVPAMMLRLDLDQECYDFVKWWATYNHGGRYDLDDMALPHLNIRGANFLEDPNFFGEFPALNHVVAVLLLKLKLLVDIRNLKIARKILASRRLPFDIWEMFELAVVRSPLSAKLQKESPDSISKIEATLLNQIPQVGSILVEANNNFMFHLFEPDKALSNRPESYSIGSWEEMALAMQYSYAAFWETEGVLDMLNDARVCTAREIEVEIKGMMEFEALKLEAGLRRTAEEMLADMSVNRMWGYFDYAVENASYLGPWFERPSERHFLENKDVYANMMAKEAEYDACHSDKWSSDED